jgi:ATP-dependent DNA helicase PIF1
LRGKAWTAHGLIAGDFDEGYLPTAVELKLKKSAQIMLLNNDGYGRWINGTIGRITGFKEDENGEDVILAKLETGEGVEISPYTWELFRFYLKDGDLASEVVGSFTQYPVRLAFAVTIHKSQGKTFEKVVIDVGRGTFAHGQMYVALSRCTSLSGIVLRQPIKKGHILMDWQVVKFLTGFQYRRSNRCCPREDKLQLIEKAIRNRKAVEIVYLKAKDEKSRRTVKPFFVGEMEYSGRPFTGTKAICMLRGGERVFNVGRILEIHETS